MRRLASKDGRRSANRLGKADPYDLPEFTPICRRGQASLSLKESAKESRILIAHDMADLLDTNSVGFEQLLCFLNTNRVHVVYRLIASCCMEPTGECAGF